MPQPCNVRQCNGKWEYFLLQIDRQFQFQTQLFFTVNNTRTDKKHIGQTHSKHEAKKPLSPSKHLSNGRRSLAHEGYLHIRTVRLLMPDFTWPVLEFLLFSVIPSYRHSVKYGINTVNLKCSCTWKMPMVVEILEGNKIFFGSRCITKASLRLLHSLLGHWC